jgi:hypothetical protein
MTASSGRLGSVGRKLQFRPGIAKTSLLIEGAGMFARVEGYESATTVPCFLNGGLRERHARADASGFAVDDQFFEPRIFAPYRIAVT